MKAKALSQHGKLAFIASQTRNACIRSNHNGPFIRGSVAAPHPLLSAAARSILLHSLSVASVQHEPRQPVETQPLPCLCFAVQQPHSFLSIAARTAARPFPRFCAGKIPKLAVSRRRELERRETALRTAQAVTDTKLEELTREVREHNGFARRMPVVEEQIRVINHRISDLERGGEKG